MNRPWKELLAPIFSLDDEGTDGETIGMGASPAAPETFTAEKRKLLQRIHRSREDNPKLRSEKKKVFLKRNDTLVCEVCRFDFESAYGGHGKDFIEFHHTKPSGELGDRTRLADLTLLCPNCHTMLHRSEPCLTIEELKEIWRG